jgi:hypothetical protein
MLASALIRLRGSPIRVRAARERVRPLVQEYAHHQPRDGGRSMTIQAGFLGSEHAVPPNCRPLRFFIGKWLCQSGKCLEIAHTMSTITVRDLLKFIAYFLLRARWKTNCGTNIFEISLIEQPSLVFPGNRQLARPTEAGILCRLHRRI